MTGHKMHRNLDDRSQDAQTWVRYDAAHKTAGYQVQVLTRHELAIVASW